MYKRQSLRSVSVDNSASNIMRSSSGVIGSRAASRAASSTFLTRLASTLLHSHVNGLKRLGLGKFDQLFACQFEHRQEMHDQAGRAHGRIEHRLDVYKRQSLRSVSVNN